MRFLRALYSNNRCFASFDGEQFFLYLIESGILQGCPLSGSLFVIAADPLLRMLEALFPNATIKAFADDLGGVFPSLRNITLLENTFKEFAQISGLHLKPAKSKILPLGREPTCENLDEVRATVRLLAPAWGSIGVATAGEYLGFQVGQTGGTLASWVKPARKYAERALQLGAAGLSAAEGAILYNTSVAAVLGYVEQLCPLDATVAKLEQGAVERSLHAPHNAVPKGLLRFGGQFGMVSIVALAERSSAALARTSRITCTSWHSWAVKLREARDAHGPLVNTALRGEAKRDYKWWHSEAFVDALGRADREAPSTASLLADNDNVTRPGRPLKLQAALYKWYIGNGTLAASAELLVTRVERLTLSAVAERPLLLLKLEASLANMKNLSPQVAWSTLRSLTNAWVTKSRMGASKTTCLFGCVEEGNYDGLKHYLGCGILWATIQCEWSRLGGGMIAELPAERLTLLDPATPPKAWTQIAGALLVATDVYHTVSRKPGFDLASEVRASIANARNHGLLKLEKLEWNSGSPARTAAAGTVEHNSTRSTTDQDKGAELAVRMRTGTVEMFRDTRHCPTSRNFRDCGAQRQLHSEASTTSYLG